MTDFEKLGAFYLGKEVDPKSGEQSPDPLLYDAKDLCTHAVIVGMTGSGKTGLGVGLIEEAAIDRIPSIVIDPKGDMANLLLQFPDMKPKDFEPWVDPGAAMRKGKTVPEFAKGTAEMWKKGIASYGQTPERIKLLQDAADFAVYTPGSSAGRQLRVLRSFAAPPQAIRDDAEALSDQIQSAVTGLLALVGIDADPLQSREAILLSNIVNHYWKEGTSLDLASLITLVQKPPFTKLGVLDLETFFPAKDRVSLAMRLNGVLASPGFAAWMEGEPLSVQDLLYTAEGKPRVSIISIAHMNDAERMFFVSLLLGEVVSWIRTQPGTSSLRALLYMDEIFGFFPPTANPPSKRPMLTLLKQARAFGLGVILSTQNPVDLDYKGLSNCGTWFLGRLQTERDKLRVLDGLEGALAAAGEAPTRELLDDLLSGLGKRVFLMNNAHESGPVLFHTRWVLSYLRGPMTRTELERLNQETGGAAASEAAQQEAEAAAPKVAKPEKVAPPPPAPPPAIALPTGVEERYLPPMVELDEGERILLRPALYSNVNLHCARSSAKVDVWRDIEAFLPLPEEGSQVDWDESGELREDPPKRRLHKRAPKGADHAGLTSSAGRKTSWSNWEKRLKSHVYKTQGVTVFKCAEYKLYSEPGEGKSHFVSRLRQASHEKRDLTLEKLRSKYQPKLERIEERVRKAHQKVEKEEEQYEEARANKWMRRGKTLLSMLTGRKPRGSSTSARHKAAKEKGDVRRAEEDLEQLKRDEIELSAEFEQELTRIRDEFTDEVFDLEEIHVAPKKTEIAIDPPKLVWRPWRVDAEGVATPAWE